MALPVNVEDLINKSKVESSRIEFKAGWNPRAIYHSICAMANDFDNLGGGYIIVGVEEEKGIAKRPVKGISLEEIDGICRDMIGYDKKMRPYYSPRTSVEEVDGRSVLVIWVASGLQRPYQVPRDVAAKDSPLEFYIRKATSSVIASESEQRELWGISDSTPFADRGKPDIRIHDISLALLRDHLVKVNSRLVDRIYDTPIEQILEQMNLLYGPVENRMVKNVAAMMFCETLRNSFPIPRWKLCISRRGGNLIPIICRRFLLSREAYPKSSRIRWSICATTLSWNVLSSCRIRQSPCAYSIIHIRHWRKPW